MRFRFRSSTIAKRSISLGFRIISPSRKSSLNMTIEFVLPSDSWWVVWTPSFNLLIFCRVASLSVVLGRGRRSSVCVKCIDSSNILQRYKFIYLLPHLDSVVPSAFRLHPVASSVQPLYQVVIVFCHVRHESLGILSLQGGHRHAFRLGFPLHNALYYQCYRL